MDYGSLIRQAWRLTWRHRFLWVLGLFAASTVGSCTPGTGGGGTQWRMGQENVGQIPPGLEYAFRDAGSWISNNAGWLGAVAIFAMLLGLGLFFVSLVAQGGMARATADLATGRRIAPGEAWRFGLRIWWKYLVLWVLLFAVGILIFAAVGLPVGIIFALTTLFTGVIQGVLIGLGVILGILAFLVAVPAFIALGVVATFAQRAMAVEQVGPLVGFGAGLRLVRGHLGRSALVWLINLALSIGAALAIALGALLLLLPLGAVTAALIAIVGVPSVRIALLVAAAVIFILALWLLGAVANTFFWNYWTLTYLNFTGRLNDRMEVPEGGAGF